jgi:hypothetical protein
LYVLKRKEKHTNKTEKTEKTKKSKQETTITKKKTKRYQTLPETA